MLDWLDFAQASDLLGKLDLGELRCTIRCSVVSCTSKQMHGLVWFFPLAAGINQRIVKVNCKQAAM